jgi:hypothetical protein
MLSLPLMNGRASLLKISRAALLGSALVLSTPLSVSADTFDVYCVPSVDGVSTCSGWSDGGTLTCVSSPGGVSSCQSSTGRQFTCIQDGSGVTTCQNPNKPMGRSGKGDNCVFIGNGSFTCNNSGKNSQGLDLNPNLIDDPITIPNSNFNTSIPNLFPD